MMIDWQHLPKWSPDLGPNRERSLSGSQTLPVLYERLETELEHLRAGSIVLQTGHRAKDIRTDGWIRAGSAMPLHSGVVLSFESNALRGGKLLGPLRFACNLYSRFGDNLRAIALHLESMRGIDRWGVAQSGQQYRGFQAIPPAETGETRIPVYQVGIADPREESARYLILMADVTATPDLISDVQNRISPRYERIRRLALAKSHPDNGGHHEFFLCVKTHIEKLEEKQG